MTRRTFPIKTDSSNLHPIYKITTDTIHRSHHISIMSGKKSHWEYCALPACRVCDTKLSTDPTGIIWSELRYSPRHHCHWCWKYLCSDCSNIFEGSYLIEEDGKLVEKASKKRWRLCVDCFSEALTNANHCVLEKIHMQFFRIDNDDLSTIDHEPKIQLPREDEDGFIWIC